MQTLRRGVGRLLPSGVRRRLKRLRHRIAPTRMILCYHRVADVACDPWELCVSPRHFAEQIQVLRRWGIILDLETLLARLGSDALPRRAVAMTFDDGYADTLHAAKPILGREAAPALVFLTTGWLRRKDEFWWDRLERLLLRPGNLPAALELAIGSEVHRYQLGDASSWDEAEWRRWSAWKASEPPPTERHALFLDLWQRLRPLPAASRQPALDHIAAWAGEPGQEVTAPRPLCEAEARLLFEDGLVGIGAHTVTHPLLPALAPAEQRDEIERSRSDCASLIGRTPAGFSYPYGALTADVAGAVRRAGFRFACATVGAAGSLVRRSGDRFALPRIPVGNWDGEAFARKLAEDF